MTSDRGTRKIAGEAEIEEALSERGRDRLRDERHGAAKSLSIYGWPAVTVTPLPDACSYDIAFIPSVQPGTRDSGQTCRKSQDAFIQFPRYGITQLKPCFLSLSFFLPPFVFAEETTESARKASEGAAGCGCRADNEGHRRGGDTPPRLR